MCQFQALPYEYMLFIIRIHEFSDECVLAGMISILWANVCLFTSMQLQCFTGCAMLLQGVHYMYHLLYSLAWVQGVVTCVSCVTCSNCIKQSNPFLTANQRIEMTLEMRQKLSNQELQRVVIKHTIFVNQNLDPSHKYFNRWHIGDYRRRSNYASLKK